MVVKVGRAKLLAPVACLVLCGKRLTVKHPAPLTLGGVVGGSGGGGGLTTPFTISVFLPAFSPEVENMAGVP